MYRLIGLVNGAGPSKFMSKSGGRAMRQRDNISGREFFITIFMSSVCAIHLLQGSLSWFPTCFCASSFSKLWNMGFSPFKREVFSLAQCDSMKFERKVLKQFLIKGTVLHNRLNNGTGHTMGTIIGTHTNSRCRGRVVGRQVFLSISYEKHPMGK